MIGARNSRITPHWKRDPFALVTLLEILEESAAAFFRLSSMVGQLCTICAQGRFPDMETFVSTLKEIKSIANRLGWYSVEYHFNRIEDTIECREASAATMFPLLSELAHRINNDLSDTKFLIIHRDVFQLYGQVQPIFGENVEYKFPQVSEDISEAGKCIALNRYTAAVFHLMRAMEAALKVLGIKLNVTVVDKDNVDLEWGKILSNLSSQIEYMPKGEPKQRWSSAFSLLLHAKTAWRNPTMHPKQTYTKEQAKEIFAATRSFMNSLTELV